MDAEIINKIRNMEDNLLFESSFVIEGYRTASLFERMKHYNVPGVSVAVINDFKVEWAKGPIKQPKERIPERYCPVKSSLFGYF